MSSLAVNAITDASGGTTASINGHTPTASNMAGKNRIINGDMRIDQRNAGAAVTATASFPVDRFVTTNNTDGAFSFQQDSSAPTGFVNSLKYTTTTADASLTTTQIMTIQQRIEGTNVADLAFGTANAKTVTLSFWVRSSLTGTFGGSLSNGASDRSYPFTYSISAADTWEYKTVTIPGDTTGTWLTTTGIGLRVFFSLGTGPDRLGTAGAWAGSLLTGVTGQTQVIGTLNATWYITGVQLEVGSAASEFSLAGGGQYGQELALCQRYYEVLRAGGTMYWSSGNVAGTASYKVDKRTAPTVTRSTSYYAYPSAASFNASNITNLGFTINSSGSYLAGDFDWLCASEL